MKLKGIWVDALRVLLMAWLFILPACSEVEENNQEARRRRDDVLVEMKQVYETKTILRMHLTAVDARVERYMLHPETTDSLTTEEESLYEERARILNYLELLEEDLRVWIAEEADQADKSGWWPSESARAQSRIRLDRITEISQSIDSLLKKSKHIGHNNDGDH